MVKDIEIYEHREDSGNPKYSRGVYRATCSLYDYIKSVKEDSERHGQILYNIRVSPNAFSFYFFEGGNQIIITSTIVGIKNRFYNGDNKSK